MAFDSVGMPYDVLDVNESTILDLISPTGVGKYAGFVSTTSDLLNPAQQQIIMNYQAQVLQFVFSCFILKII